MEQGLELDYYPLSLVAEMTGKNEDYFNALGAQRALKFYVRPKNWAYRKKNNPCTAYVINDPVWVDDHVVLKKVLNGAEATLFFSEQYPESYLENMDDEEVCTLDNENHFDEVVTQLGVPVAKDRLVIKREDLAPFLLKQPLDGGASGQADAEPVSTKIKGGEKQPGRNERRMKILKNWYSNLCTKHNNNHELIVEEINRLTNNEIIEELKNLTPDNDKFIWTIRQAKRWFMDNGAAVWGFKKDQGGKAKAT